MADLAIMFTYKELHTYGEYFKHIYGEIINGVQELIKGSKDRQLITNYKNLISALNKYKRNGTFDCMFEIGGDITIYNSSIGQFLIRFRNCIRVPHFDFDCHGNLIDVPGKYETGYEFTLDRINAKLFMCKMYDINVISNGKDNLSLLQIYELLDR